VKQAARRACPVLAEPMIGPMEDRRDLVVVQRIYREKVHERLA
jgi:hypothetical protein